MKNTTPIHVFAKWKVKEGQTETVLTLLKTVCAESIKEEGNLFYNVHQSNTDPELLLLYEGYTSEEAIAAHRNAAHFQEIVVAKIVPLLAEREVILTTPLLL